MLAAAAEPDAAREEPVADARVRVGDATSQLLALQRSGDTASQVARPIAGDVATRSYQRYLKSFDHPIPERYGTTVGGTSSGNSSGSSPR